MPDSKTYDIAIIGAGPGGVAAAAEAARRDAHVALIEREHPGGTCLNWGCIPTKTLLATAEIIHRASLGSDMGLGESPPTLDWPALRARSAKVVERLRQAHHQDFKRLRIAYRVGTAELKAPGCVSLTPAEGQPIEIKAPKIILATGSRPGGLPGLEPNGDRLLSSNHALGLESLPPSLLIIGGGVIGCEFASLFSDLGVEVTIIEALPSLLSLAGIDGDVVRELTRNFKKRRIAMHFEQRVEALDPQGEGLIARLSGGKTVTCAKTLLCVGRRLNTEGLGLDRVGIALGPDGSVAVNEHMETPAPGIYAIGDITGQAQLAHVATHHGLVAARHAMGDASATFDSSAIPGVVFTRPCVATVGLSEEAARSKGLDPLCTRRGARALGKAHAAGELDGLFKVVADRESGKVLGVHLMGAGAEDLIAEGTLAVRHGLTLDQIADTIHPHPTMSEGLWEAAAELRR